MGQFFNPDNFLWRGLGKLGDFFMLSCCWVLCCVPVGTIGAACIALYDATAHCVRGGEGGMYRRFFRTFKNELGRGFLLTLFWAVIGFFLNASYQILTQLAQQRNGWTVFSLVYFISLFIPLGIVCWAVAVESRFTNSFFGLHKTALVLSFAHLPYTIAIVALLVLVINVLINIPLLVMLLPGLMVYLQSFFIEKVLKKYMPADEA